MTHPDDLLDQLQKTATPRKQKTLDLIHEVCREQYERGSRDFSVATIARIAEDRGGPSKGAIHNKTGDDYKGLIKAWAEHTGGVTRKVRQVSENPYAALIDKIRRVLNRDIPILILGETGTGKELIAQAIHALSARHDHEMVKVNCAAIPTGLIESDLFGHEKGAFTGALTQRIGRFERAHKGTLFLDEVGDMPLDLQPKLLRVLQEHELERVGNSNPIAIDVRLVAATNCDLLSMVKNKRFRSDLYYRLNVFPIELPPLRERREDIPLLVNFFIKKIAKRMRRTITSIPADAMKMLVSLPWYGNIRELENIIERAVVMTRGHVLNLSPDELLPLKGFHKIETLVYDEPARELFREPLPALPQGDEAQGEDERVSIIRALKACNGIVAGERGAAQRLGMKRTTLLSKMKRLGISAKDPRTLN